jgi:hypothetical protein
MNRPPRRAVSLYLAPGSLLIASLLGVSTARADVPAGYKGRPFDPAVAGGAGIIPTTVKAGPYAIPGRLDLINYDLGGSGVTFSAAHKEVKGGAGYRTDAPTASLALTTPAKMNLWYQASATLDGTLYPSPTTEDFYLGALDAGDWFDYTVDVQIAGSYSVSSTWATGNGPPGGEGGDGSIGLQIFVNGTKMVDWKDAFPNYMTTANYHNWKPYPDFATLTLQAGLQVIKLQCTSNHQNLDYLQFDLAGADGGASTDAGSGGGAGASGAGGGSAGGASGSADGAAPDTASDGETTGAGGDGTAGTSGAGGAAGSTSGSTTGTAGATSAKHPGGGGCAVAELEGSKRAGWPITASLLTTIGLATRRRRRSAYRKGAWRPRHQTS